MGSAVSFGSEASVRVFLRGSGVNATKEMPACLNSKAA